MSIILKYVIHFPKMRPISVGSADNFCKSYEKKFRSNFDQWSKLYFGLNVQQEIKILKELSINLLRWTNLVKSQQLPVNRISGIAQRLLPT